MTRLRPLAALLLTCFYMGPYKLANAALMSSWQFGAWHGGAYSNDTTNQFSHCAAYAPYMSGIAMVVAIDRAASWKIGFTNPAWRLSPGQQIPVTVTFDGGSPWTGTASAMTTIFVGLPMSSSSALIRAFRSALRMDVYAAGSLFQFDLTGTSRLLPELARCVETQVAAERGESSPTFNRTVLPAPSQPVNAQPSASERGADLELVATRIVTNLLLQARLPNARLLSGAETPAGLKGLGVAWSSDLGFGAVELLPESAKNDAGSVAATLVASDSAGCKGDFASGRSSELVDDTLVTKALTGCKDSGGTRAFRYFIVHKEGEPYIVYALASGGSSAGGPAGSPLSDGTFQVAAVKAAFTR